MVASYFGFEVSTATSLMTVVFILATGVALSIKAPPPDELLGRNLPPAVEVEGEEAEEVWKAESRDMH